MSKSRPLHPCMSVVAMQTCAYEEIIREHGMLLIYG